MPRNRQLGKLRTDDYVMLPTNLILNSGTVLDACDALTDWAGSSTPSGGSLSQETTIIKEGTGSLKIVTPNSAGGREDATKTCAWKLTGNLRFWAYDDQTTAGNGLDLLLSNDSGFSNYLYKRFIEGRSKEALQTENRVRGGSYKKTRYLSEMINNYIKNMTK